jgi:hypothetical protein
MRATCLSTPDHEVTTNTATITKTRIMDETPKRWLSRAGTRTKRAFSVKKSIRRVVKRDEEATGPDSGEYDFLCSVCTRLLISPASQKKIFTKDGFSRGGAKLYHEEGCRLCQQIVEVLRSRDASESRDWDFSQCTLHAVDKNRQYIFEYENYGFGYGVGSEDKTSGPAELTQLAFFHVQLGSGEQTDMNLQSLVKIAPCFSKSRLL